MKRNLSFFLVCLALILVLTCTVRPAQAAEVITGGACGRDVTWELDSEGTLTISGQGDMQNYAYGMAPWYFDYAYGSFVRSVVIEPGVTSVASFAFQGLSGVTEVTIPDTVTTIEERAFLDCSSLVEADIPDSVEYIAMGAFENCSGLTTVTIPASVTAVGSNAFKNCQSLTDLTLCDGLTALGKNMFTGCTALTHVAIPGSVSVIPDSAFYECFSLEEVTIGEGITELGSHVFCRTWLDKVTLPDSLRIIGSYAFGFCDLETVALPQSLTKIDTFAFSGCGKLTDVTIPANVTDIGSGAFDGCTKISGLSLDPGNTALREIDGILYNADLTALVSVPSGWNGGELEIPEGVTVIPWYAIRDCEGVTSVRIPASVTEYQNQAISECPNLLGIYFEGDAPTFADRAFVSQATTAYYPAGNDTWTEDVRQEYQGSILWQPYTAETEGSYSGKCGDDITWHLDADGHMTITGAGEMATPGSFEAIRPLVRTLEVGEGVTTISASAFEYCENLTAVTLPDSLTFIDEYAFYHCTALTGVTIPAGVSEIDTTSFWQCYNLEGYDVAPDNQYYRSIDGVLYSKNYNTLFSVPVTRTGSFSIPNGVTRIAEYAFVECTELTAVSIPNGVRRLERFCFAECHQLTELVLPMSVEYVGYYAFAASSLGSVKFTGDLPELDDWAFAGSSPIAWYPANNLTWQNLTPAGYGSFNMEWMSYYEAPTRLPGDVNDDNTVNSDDAIYLLYHTLFGDSLYPASGGCDFDGSGSVDSDDAIYLLYHTLFGEGLYPLTKQN